MKWFEENGFDNQYFIRSRGNFIHKIFIFYDSSCIEYRVCWKIYKRGVIESIGETDNEIFNDYKEDGYKNAIDFIKEHSDEKFKLVENHIKKYVV